MGYFGIRKSCHVIPGIYEWLHTGHMHPLYGGEGEGPQGTPGGKGWRSGGHVALFSMGLELGTSNSAGGIHTPFIWFHSIFSDTSRWTQVTAVFGNSAFCEAIHLWDWCAPLQLLGCTYYFFYLCGFQELKTPKSIIVHTKAEHKKGLKFKATFIFVSRDTCFFIFFFYMGLPNIMISQTPWIIGHPSAIFRAQVEWRDLVGPAEPDCHAVHCCSRGMRRGATARWPAA